jgi:hypothetical protein
MLHVARRKSGGPNSAPAGNAIGIVTAAIPRWSGSLATVWASRRAVHHWNARPLRTSHPRESKTIRQIDQARKLIANPTDSPPAQASPEPVTTPRGGEAKRQSDRRDEQDGSDLTAAHARCQSDARDHTGNQAAAESYAPLPRHDREIIVLLHENSPDGLRQSGARKGVRCSRGSGALLGRELTSLLVWQIVGINTDIVWHGIGAESDGCYVTQSHQDRLQDPVHSIHDPAVT